MGPNLLPLILLLLLVTIFASATEDDGRLLVEDVVLSSVSHPAVPALFVFGDSVVDAGTNNYFPSLLRANFKPYGAQYFGKPTGRFTNGRTYVDFLARYVRLPLVEPYLKRKSKRSAIIGVNYASAGSGFLRTSNAQNLVIPFSDQILQFGQTKTLIEQTLNDNAAATELFAKSLFLINSGVNDVIGYIFNASGPQEVFFKDLLVILNASVEVLYKAGARKVMVVGLGPLGCIPGALAAAGLTNGTCAESWNGVAQAWNAALEQFVYSLNETFPDIIAIVGKPYSKFQDFLLNGKNYGFTAGLTACCGSGVYNAAFQCGRPADLIENPPTNLCHDVTHYVYWDYYHPTERVHGMIAEEFWSGNSSVVSPVNLRALVSY